MHLSAVDLGQTRARKELGLSEVDSMSGALHTASASLHWCTQAARPEALASCTKHAAARTQRADGGAAALAGRWGQTELFAAS